MTERGSKISSVFVFSARLIVLEVTVSLFLLDFRCSIKFLGCSKRWLLLLVHHFGCVVLGRAYDLLRMEVLLLLLFSPPSTELLFNSMTLGHALHCPSVPFSKTHLQSISIILPFAPFLSPKASAPLRNLQEGREWTDFACEKVILAGQGGKWAVLSI
jgi:hypothetical protein